jgi:diguanylate cyclase (GGDEF)-like protein
VSARDTGREGRWKAVERLITADEKGGAERVLRTATALVCEFLGDRASCVLFDDRARIRVATDAPRFEGQEVDLRLYPEIVAAIDSRELVAIEDVTDAAILDPVRHLLPRGLGAIAVVPLEADGHCRGVVIARSRKARAMSPEEREAAHALVRLAGHLCNGGGLFAYGPDGEERPGSLAPQQVERRATPVKGVSFRGMGRATVLIVGGEDGERKDLCDALTTEGYAVKLAPDSTHALETARTDRPEVILVDVTMPEASGYKIAGELARDRRTQFSSVIFMSGVDELPRTLRAHALEDADFLRKPYEHDELLARVQHAVFETKRRAAWHQKATTDELTGLGNLRLLRERLGVEASRIARYGTALTVVVADLDGLKAINDRFGHLAGSRLIKAAGQAFAEEVRETDVAARYGGDEFLVLLPHTTLADGGAFARRVLDRIRRLGSPDMPVSASLGVASFDNRADKTLDDLIARADRATYRAKAQGRDRVCVDEPG